MCYDIICSWRGGVERKEGYCPLASPTCITGTSFHCSRENGALGVQIQLYHPRPALFYQEGVQTVGAEQKQAGFENSLSDYERQQRKF